MIVDKALVDLKRAYLLHQMGAFEVCDHRLVDGSYDWKSDEDPYEYMVVLDFLDSTIKLLEDTIEVFNNGR